MKKVVKISIWIMGNKHTHASIITKIKEVLEIPVDRFVKIDESNVWEGTSTS